MAGDVAREVKRARPDVVAIPVRHAAARRHRARQNPGHAVALLLVGAIAICHATSAIPSLVHVDAARRRARADCALRGQRPGARTHVAGLEADAAVVFCAIRVRHAANAKPRVLDADAAGKWIGTCGALRMTRLSFGSISRRAGRVRAACGKRAKEQREAADKSKVPECKWQPAARA